jgi:hypothetical protein
MPAQGRSFKFYILSTSPSIEGGISLSFFNAMAEISALPKTN